MVGWSRCVKSGWYGEMLIKEFENAGYAVKVTETTRLRSEIVD